MKKYLKNYETTKIDQLHEEYVFLQLFQFTLRNSSELNERYQGKGLEIADGIQPWIDALEISLNS